MREEDHQDRGGVFGGSGPGATSNRMSGNSEVAIQAARIGDVTINLGAERGVRLAEWQIKDPAKGFVNRQDELGRLGRVFEDPAAGVALVLLLGPAGVGKTELGRRLAEKYRERFRYGYQVALSDFRGESGAVDLSAVFRVLLLAMGVAESAVPATRQEREVLYRARAMELDVLVMVDDVELNSQLTALAPGGRGALLVTSRRMLEQWRGVGTVVEEIGPLDERAALELLSDHIGRERVEAEPEAAVELAQWCAGIPVLLRAVGGYLVLRRRCRLEDAVGLMRDSRERSRVFERGDAFTVLDVVFAQLPEPAGPAYRALGVVPAAEMSTGAVAVAAGIDSSQARIGLDALVEANLLEDLGAGRFAVHAMLRAHAEHLVTRAYSEAERTATARRVVEWYLACAQAADRAVAAERIRLPGAVMQASDDVPAPRFADDRAALDWLETEHAALLGCLRIAVEHEWDELVWQLCDPLWALNQSHRHPAAWIEALNRGIEAGKRAGNHWVGARLRCLLSRCHVELKQYDRAAAALDGALDLARLSGDVMLEASTLEFAGVVERDAGRPGAALELFDAGRQVLAGLEPGPGPQRADLILRYHTGKALTALGRIGEARTVLEAAYPEAQLGDARLAGRVRLALIAALLAGSEPARARDLATSALDEASRRRVPEERINALRILARSCEALGERDSAEGYAAEANTIERALQGWSSVAP